MSSEITYILEPDKGRITVESSTASKTVASEIKRDLGKPIILNCARPTLLKESIRVRNESSLSFENSAFDENNSVYLFRIYHYSTVDGPGRRSVVQLAGCSIRCPSCYVPETHNIENGTRIFVDEIVARVDKKSGEHNGVTILGGEPFDQIDGLITLVEKLKEKSFDLTIYSGYTLENLLRRKNPKIDEILAKTDLLIDGAYDRELTNRAGEYRGSSNQQLHPNPFSK